jgi:hypothetical protein
VYVSRGFGHLFGFTSEQVAMYFAGTPQDDAAEQGNATASVASSVIMRWIGGNADAQVSAVNPAAHVTNYLTGSDPSNT